MAGKAKRGLKVALATLLGLHLLGGAVSYVVFQRQYAREHSGWNWFWFGTIVPGLKAFVWEYYVVAGMPRKEAAAVEDLAVSAALVLRDCASDDPSASARGREAMASIKERLSRSDDATVQEVRRLVYIYLAYDRSFAEDLKGAFFSIDAKGANLESVAANFSLSADTIAALRRLPKRLQSAVGGDIERIQRYGRSLLAQTATVDPAQRAAFRQHITDGLTRKAAVLADVYRELFGCAMPALP